MSHTRFGLLIRTSPWLGLLTALACKTPASEEKPPVDDKTEPSAAASPMPPTAASATVASVNVHEGEDWVESDRYQARVTEARYCTLEGADNPSPAPPGARLPKGMRALGVKLEVKAKIDEIFVAPKHGTLYDGGIRVAPKAERELAGGNPPIKAVMLKKDQSTSGFIVFDGRGTI
jgi:hypothetical protein